MKKTGRWLSVAIMFTFFAVTLYAGGSREVADESDGLSVFVSILPQKYFVERIGGERVSVEVMVLPGRSPATYEPTPNQVTALSRADVFFSIGVPFEDAFIPRISESLKSLRISNTSEGIRRRILAAELHEQEAENHDDEDEDDEDGHHHEEGSVDPHIWLSPVLVKKQAENILRTLIELDPEGRDVYTEGYNQFASELDEVDREIHAVLSPFAGSVLFVFHPSFGYFADEYGLHQVAVELEGREPTPSELEEIIEYANDEDVKIIFAQPEFSQRSVAALADAVNGSVVVLNPLDPDYINSMKNIAEEIKKAYK